MSSVLTINGSTVTRSTARVRLDRLTLSMDAPQSLEFTEIAVAAGNGTYHSGQTCALTVDGTQVFSGGIVFANPLNIGSGPIDVGYRAFDLRFLASLIPITATDGTGVLAYNFPSTDPSYLASQSGQSVGAILKAVFDLHSTQLAAIGISGYNATELSALTVVPPEPIVLSGRLWTAVEAMVAQWCNKYAMWIDGAGLIHVVNTISGLTSTTLTLGTDPIVLGAISRDHSECFTQVVARGGANLQGAYLRLSDGSLQAGWTSSQQAAWTVTDYYQPKNASDSGSITSMTSTTITITSDNTSKTWATNYWSGQGATLWVMNTSATGITFQEQRQITACGALTAGGSCTITVDYAFDNSGYNRYFIRGFQPKPPSDQGSITSMTSTVLTVTSSNTSETWASNYWATQNAIVIATKTVSGVVYTEKKSVTACGALTAGGSTTITVGSAFSGSGYTSYFVYGTVPDQSLVWRKYTIPNAWIAEHLQPRFNHAIPFNTNTGAIAQVWTATAVVCWSTTHSTPYNEFPVTLQVIQYDGQIDGYLVFDQPVVFAFNQRTDLESGGSHVVAPDDLIVLVPYSRGAITAQAPASGYQGTAYTTDGVQRTLYLDYPSWLDARNTTAMATLAQEVLDTVNDTVVEGSVTYYGKLSSALTLGMGLNIAIAGGGTTGWESLNAPVRSVTLEWPQSGATPWVTRLNFSTRRRPFSGDRLYVHPSFGQAGRFQGGLTMGPIQEGAGVGFGNSLVDDRLAAFSDASGVESADLSGLSSKGVRSGLSDSAKAEARRRRLPGPPIAAASQDVQDSQRIAGPSYLDKKDQEAQTEAINQDQRENARRLAARKARESNPSPQVGANDLPSDAFASKD